MIPNSESQEEESIKKSNGKLRKKGATWPTVQFCTFQQPKIESNNKGVVQNHTAVQVRCRISGSIPYSDTGCH